MENESKGNRLKYLRNNNVNQILRILSREGDCARNKLVKQLGLSKMTVSNLVNLLIGLGYIEEYRVENKMNINVAGPKPMFLRIRENRIITIGITLQGDVVEGELIDIATGSIPHTKVSMMRSFRNLDIPTSIKTIIHTILIKHINIRKRIIGVGIAYNGLVDAEQGILYTTNAHNELSEVKIKRQIEKQFALPTYVCSDVQAAAFAEVLFGQSKRKSSFLFIGFGRQIKSAFVEDNMMHFGYSGLCGELGHVSVRYDGPVCECGNRGCFHMYASTPVLLQKSGKDSVSELIQAIHERDPQTIRTVESYIQITATMIVNLLNILDSECIILGYDAKVLPNYIVKEIERLVNEKCIQKKNRYIRLVTATFGYEGILLGAGVLPIHQIFLGNLILDLSVKEREENSLS